jgi:hypothetical protein
MRFFAAVAISLALTACTTVHIAPDATLRKGATIQMATMSQDPLGGAARLTVALEQRGFIVLAGEVGKSVTNQTPTGTETFRPTNASHYITFTYTTRGDGHASCRLVNLQTRRTEVTFEITPLTSSATAKCADAIAQAAK